MFNHKRQRDEFNAELDEWVPPGYDGDTYEWPEEQGRPAPYFEDAPEEEYRPAVPLPEGAKTLPAFKDTTRAMGVRGFIHPLSDDKIDRIEHIRREYAEAMHAIAHAYDTAMTELYDGHRAFDEYDDQCRAKYPLPRLRVWAGR
jgi:hypothetical protein